MSVEALHQPPFGGKEEYTQTPLEKFQSCGVIAHAIDSVLHESLSSNVTLDTNAECDSQGIYVHRLFEYLAKDSGSGRIWSFAGKRFDITYMHDRSPGTHTHETYTVAIRTILLQAGFENHGLQNTYTLEFYGADRESGSSVVEHPNFVEPNEPDMVIRDTTPYDQELLGRELAELQTAIHASGKEHSLATAFILSQD